MMSLDQAPINQLIIDNIDTWTSTVKTKSASGRGSSKKRELYGVKRLRELILELAVRGKLVPQDPTDEPASVLLERIAVEKAQLVKDKKIKKQKALPEISEQDVPFLAPVGWEWTRLDDLVEVLDSRRKPISKKDRVSGPYPYYGASGIVDFVDDYIFDENLILIGEDGAKWGKGDNTAFPVTGKSWVNNHVHVVRGIHSGLVDQFLVYSLVAQDLNEYITGITVPKLNQARLRTILVAVPCEAEQKRIVAKVDELMILCDQLEQQTEASIEAHQVLVTTLLDTLTNSANAEELMQNWQMVADHFDTLFTTEASIDQLKQTILQLAVMGKLVPQDPNDEPAAKLLERIAEEKAQLIKEKKIKKQKALPPISDDEMPFELPSGWEWCRLGSLINLVSGQHLKPSEYSETPLENGNPYITGPAEFGPIYPSFSKYTTEKRALAQGGDVLITCKGAGLGKLNKANQTLAISRQLMSMQSICINKDFLFAIVDSKYDYFQSKGVGIAIPGISREDVTELVVALPPITEQSEIISKLKDVFIICDQLEQRLRNSQQTQLQLTDAIVGKYVDTPVKKINMPKDKSSEMMISTILSTTNVSPDNNSPIALILKQEGGNADAKEIWNKSRFSLPDFYKQLKKEIEAGYIEMPSPATANK